MDYRFKSYLVVAVLLLMVSISGVLIANVSNNIVFSSNQGEIDSNGLTGATVSEPCLGDDCPEGCDDYSCIIACYNDEDCDDRIEATEDVCKNPGTEFSVCVNQRN